MPQKRFYGLYYKVNGKYRRVVGGAFYKDVAVQVFQNKLLAGLVDGACLRPVKEGEPIYYVVHGAYGRWYLSSVAALNDWNAGKDFQILGGPYCSKRDDIHVLIRLRSNALVEAHGTPKEATPCPDTATT